MTSSTSIKFLFMLQILCTSFFLSSHCRKLSCDPHTVCKFSNPGTKTSDPKSCHHYYMCVLTPTGVKPSDQPISCPPGQYFNFEKGSCQTETTPCGNPCLNHQCLTKCYGRVGKSVAYPDDCTKYYVCLTENDKVLVECPDDAPFFNGNTCSTDANSCCALCEPYCSTAATEVRDPFDCRGYYICLDAHTQPTSSQWYSCPSDMHFDVRFRSCVEDGRFGEGCSNLCSHSSDNTTQLMPTTFSP